MVNPQAPLLEPSGNLTEGKAFLLLEYLDRLGVILQAAAAWFLFGLCTQLLWVGFEFFLFHMGPR